MYWPHFLDHPVYEVMQTVQCSLRRQNTTHRLPVHGLLLTQNYSHKNFRYISTLVLRRQTISGEQNVLQLFPQI